MIIVWSFWLDDDMVIDVLFFIEDFERGGDERNFSCCVSCGVIVLREGFVVVKWSCYYWLVY